MENRDIQHQIDDINRKLDIIIGEVEAQKRLRRGAEDLGDDLMRVGTDVFNSAVTELDEFTYTLDLGDVILLGKQLLRNISNIKAAFEQLESARDFIADASTISKDLFNDVLLKLDELDKKGYFSLLAESEQLLDTFVSSVSPDDLKRLNETIPKLAGMMKTLSKPEVIGMMEGAVNAFETTPFDPGRKASVFSLMKEATSPEIRSGMLYMLSLFKNTVQEWKGQESPA